MNKKREAFLSVHPMLKRFTKDSIVKHFGVTSEEFDQLLLEGFIEESTCDICSNCYRTWDSEYEECKYCGEEEFVKDSGFYCYKK